MDDTALVSARELARRLGMATSSIYRMAASGAIPSYAAGPQLTGRRFDVAEVKEALRHAAMGQTAAETPHGR